MSIVLEKGLKMLSDKGLKLKENNGISGDLRIFGGLSPDGIDEGTQHSEVLFGQAENE